MHSRTRQTEGRFKGIRGMLLRLRLLLITLGAGSALLVVLCLGAQNLSDRYRLNLGVGRTAPLPAGFIVGVSTVLGVISGGSLAAVLMPQSQR